MKAAALTAITTAISTVNSKAGTLPVPDDVLQRQGGIAAARFSCGRTIHVPVLIIFRIRIATTNVPPGVTVW
jgi:hypothetical protein